MGRYAEMLTAALNLTSPNDVVSDPEYLSGYEEYVRGMAELIVDTCHGEHGFADPVYAKEAIISILSGGRF